MKKLFFLAIILLLNSCSENPSNVIGESYCKFINAPRSAQYDIREEIKPIVLDALNQILQDEVGKSYCEIADANEWKILTSVFYLPGTEDMNWDKIVGENPVCKIDEEAFGDFLGDVEELCKT